MTIKKRRGLLVLMVGLLVVAIIGVFKVGSGEPRYHFRHISSWLAEYGDGPDDYNPSPEADHALRQMGATAVPYLLKLLHSTNSHSHFIFVAKDNHQRGLYPVITPGDSSSSVGDHLKAWSVNLRSRFQRVTTPASWDHWKAYLAFQALGPEGRSAIPDLVKLASGPGTDSSPSGTSQVADINFWRDKKRIAVFVAQSPTYGPEGHPVIPIRIFIGGSYLIIQPFLSDAEIGAWSLAAIGADSVQPLMGMLTNANAGVRVRAAIALGLMGKAAEPAVPKLVEMLSDPDANARRESADALGWIGQRPDDVVPALTKMFGDEEVLYSAITALGTIGQGATNAIPALLKLLSATTDKTRDHYVIHCVASALNRISSDVTRKEVIPLLIDEMQNAESPWSRSLTIDTLCQLTNQPDLIVPPLLEALERAEDPARYYIVRYFGEVGPAAKAAVPKLIPLSTGQNTNLCRVVTNSLDKIKPGWRTSQ
jgi:HEAT repeat protein